MSIDISTSAAAEHWANTIVKAEMPVKPKELDSMTFSSKLPASRYVLQRIAKDGKDPDFTELLRLHCKARVWEREQGRITLVFVMESQAHHTRMLAALKKHFTRIQKLYAEEGDLQIFNIKSCCE